MSSRPFMAWQIYPKANANRQFVGILADWQLLQLVETRPHRNIICCQRFVGHLFKSWNKGLLIQVRSYTDALVGKSLTSIASTHARLTRLGQSANSFPLERQIVWNAHIQQRTPLYTLFLRCHIRISRNRSHDHKSASKLTRGYLEEILP